MSQHETKKNVNSYCASDRPDVDNEKKKNV